MKTTNFGRHSRKHSKRPFRQITALLLTFVLCYSAAADTTTVQTVEAAPQKTITIATFAKKIENAIGVDPLEKEPIISDTGKAVTVEVAAYLLNKADASVNGGDNSYNFDLYGYIKYFNRISDIDKASKKYKESLYKCFAKGIMVGKSNGKYSSDRRFSPKSKISTTDVKGLISRLKNKSKRYKLSYDGQVIRTVNLPKNYKDYPYILASFPNSFYEREMWYTKQRTKRDKTPAQTAEILSDEEKDMLCEKIRKNLELRLNIDYRTSMTADWKKELADTYFDSDTKLNSINAYMMAAKNRKVVMSSSRIVVDPSSLWLDETGTTCYARIYIKFKVKNGNIPSAKSCKQNEVIYGGYTAIKDLSKKKTITFSEEVYCNISYTGKKLTSYGLSWTGAYLADTVKSNN